jgi:hypothetical protein
MRSTWSVLICVGCSAGPEPASPSPTPIAAIDAAPVDAAPAVETPDAGAPISYLRGSTHVHAKPSGDSTTEIASVIAWYEQHGYDFIVLSDHNRVTEVGGDTTGKVAVRAPESGLIVLAGVELTFNPSVCLPQDVDMKCRIHVNAIGVTKRPIDKIEWADRETDQRLAMYARALTTTQDLGGIAQLNHPQWQWGMQADLLTELGRRGYLLVEIANRQFDNWNAGDLTHPSMEALWDAALTAGVDIWGVASDDAHDYEENGGGRYPAGGGWVMVRAARDPDAIKAALAAGHFYSSTGVTLSRADHAGHELIVEVDASSAGDHAISFVSDGKLLDAVTARSARIEIPAGRYVRAVVRRLSDNAMAWTQPARRQ